MVMDPGVAGLGMKVSWLFSKAELVSGVFVCPQTITVSMRSQTTPDRYCWGNDGCVGCDAEFDRRRRIRKGFLNLCDPSEGRIFLFSFKHVI